MGIQGSLCTVPRFTDKDQLATTQSLSRSTKKSTLLIKGQPYKLTSEADQTYRKLMREYHNSQFLNVKSKKQIDLDLQVKQFQSYYKIPYFDAYYHGQWKHYQPHGRGIAVFPQGSLLIGTFINGYCEGNNCYFIYPDGSYYIGSVTNNKLNGKGKFVSKLIQYQGTWLENLPHGEGTESYSNGDRYIGKFQNGLKNGPDELFIWKNDENYIQYKGNFKEGRIEGEGALTLHNSRRIEGIFREQDIFNCVFTSKEYKFKGKYEHGFPNGQGILQLPNHTSYQGHFHQCELNGHCSLKDQKQRSNDVFFFQGNQLKTVKGMDEQQIQQIINIIQECYKQAQKHSDALAQLSEDLDSYECRFIQPFERIYSDKFMIVGVFQKLLLIKWLNQ